MESRALNPVGLLSAYQFVNRIAKIAHICRNDRISQITHQCQNQRNGKFEFIVNSIRSNGVVFVGISYMLEIMFNIFLSFQE